MVNKKQNNHNVSKGSSRSFDIQDIDVLELGDKNYYSDNENNRDYDEMSGGSLDRKLKVVKSVNRPSLSNYKDLPLRRNTTTADIGFRSNPDAKRPTSMTLKQFTNPGAGAYRRLSHSGTVSPHSPAKKSKTNIPPFNPTKKVKAPVEQPPVDPPPPTQLESSSIETQTQIPSTENATMQTNKPSLQTMETQTNNLQPPLQETPPAKPETANASMQTNILQPPPETSPETPSPETPQLQPETPPPPTKKIQDLEKKNRRYYDKNKNVHRFEKKYMQDSSIGNVIKDPIYGDEYNFENHLKKLTDFLAGSFDFLKIPDLDAALSNFIKIREKNFYMNHLNEIQFIEDDRYLIEIKNAIATEPKHKVKIFKFNLYLFNIDSNIKTFVEQYNLNQSHHLSRQYNTFINKILGYFDNNIDIDKGLKGGPDITGNDTDKYSIKHYYHSFNVKKLETNNPYIEMYIPKLTTNSIVSMTGGSNENIVEIDPLTKIDINTERTITNSNADANDIESIEKEFAGNYWKTVTNNNPTTYGFDSNEGFSNVRNENRVKFSDKKVQDYFNKCNDLQIFYINKHIEIYEIFKEIIKAIKNNLLINDIILKLLDPDLFQEKDDNFIELKNIMTDIDDLNKAQNTILNFTDEIKSGKTQKATSTNSSNSSTLSTSSTSTLPFNNDPILTNPIIGNVGAGENVAIGENVGENVGNITKNKLNGGSREPEPQPEESPETEFSLELKEFNRVEDQLLNGKPMSIFETIDNEYTKVGNRYQYFDNTIEPPDFINCSFTEFIKKLSNNKKCKIIFGTNMIYFNDYYFVNDNENDDDYIGKITYNTNAFNFIIKNINYKAKSMTIQGFDNNTGSIDFTTINPENCIIDIPNLKRHYINFKNSVIYFTTIPDKQIIFGKLEKDENGDALMMTYNKKESKNNLENTQSGTESNDGTFVNILTHFDDDEKKNFNDEYIPFNIIAKKAQIIDFTEKWHPVDKEDKKMKFMFVDFFIDNIETYRTLQLIKRIQLMNDESLHNILNPASPAASPKKSLDKIISDYKDNIPIKFKNPDNANGEPIKEKQKPRNSPTTTRWKNFSPTNSNTFSNNNLYFNTSRFGKPESITSSDKAQQTIYKCYDLQILYLIKHLEFIELFKLYFYFIDMLFKKVAVLLFVLALYKKRAYDKYVSLQIKKILEQPILVKDQQSVFGNLVGGGNSNVESDPNLQESSVDYTPVETQQENQENQENPENLENQEILEQLTPPTTSKLFEKNKYYLEDDPLTLRNKKADKLRKEAQIIKELKEKVVFAQNLTDREKYKEDLEEKQAKIALDILLFQLSEEKRLYSYDKKQEQMQYIGTLSQLNSKAGINVTNKFIKTNKFYDKQAPVEHSKIAILRNINNPNRSIIKSAYTEIETAKHNFESGECLGHNCTINERIEKLSALYNSYINYFKAAQLFGENTNNNNSYSLIETVLKINPLEPCNTIDNTKKGFKQLRCLSKSIEILIEAQHVYANNIDIGYLLDKAKTEYNASPENTKKTDYYITILTEYYKLLKQLYIKLEEKENLTTIVLKDTTNIDKHKKNCLKLLTNIDNTIKKKKISTISAINSLYASLLNSFNSIDTTLSDDDLLIKEYEKIENGSNYLLSIIDIIQDIEVKNDKINSSYEAEKMTFDALLKDTRPDANLLENKYIPFVEKKMKEKKELITRLEQLLKK